MDLSGDLQLIERFDRLFNCRRSLSLPIMTATFSFYPPYNIIRIINPQSCHMQSCRAFSILMCTGPTAQNAPSVTIASVHIKPLTGLNQWLLCNMHIVVIFG